MVEVESKGGFSPNWRTHPGEHLEEYLEVKGWTQADFARRAGMTPKLVSEILSAKNPVTPETAFKLQRVFGLKAEIWMSLQSKWDLEQFRAKEAKKPIQLKDWLSEFPVSELKKRGALPRTSDHKVLADALCTLFGIGDPTAFSGLVKNMAVQHRKAVGDAKDGHVWSWLILGESAASKLELPRFSEDKFREAVQEIRGLTLQRPEDFEPRMRKLCRDAGVALVFEPPISKTKLFGSARWFNGGRNAIIQLSLRMKTNDHLWWTFFHECGHIVLHKGKNFADDKNAHGDGLEHEADKWAEQLLYGDEGVEPIIELLRRPSEPLVQKHARRLRLHPGILVGMLQHYQVIHYSELNHLKARYDWAE
ncbi:MAG: HigA family addiction module antitoxin [Hyphomonas sp.]|uniref:HigA family addiction module antitoxin n=1 Tax=Hyphomonas sp. TaxID=87 RepID=UPI0030021FFF|tara:strand:- start:1008 stop:2099 length:1092 start_codon:yes stop_codon:yes gene_type:complete